MIWNLAFSPDGRRLASSACFPTGPAEVKLWDVAGGRELLTIRTTEVGALMNSGLAFSPDGHRLSFIPGGSRRDAEVQMWDATPMPEEGPEISRRRP